mgnify:CR=1 FL=1
MLVGLADDTFARLDAPAAPFRVLHLQSNATQPLAFRRILFAPDGRSVLFQTAAGRLQYGAVAVCGGLTVHHVQPLATDVAAIAFGPRIYAAAVLATGDIRVFQRSPVTFTCTAVTTIDAAAYGPPLNRPRRRPDAQSPTCSSSSSRTKHSPSSATTS